MAETATHKATAQSNGMKPSLKDQLQGVKLDYSAYARLPIREDVLTFEPNKEALEVLDRLLYLKRHLKAIDIYIKKNKGETVNEFMSANKMGLSKKVLEKIGSHNNETGGISAYFFNLQNFYDQEEEKFDSLESSAKIEDDIKRILSEMRDARIEKRKTRRDARKIHLKNLKADGKGYLMVDAGEEPEEVPAKEPTKEESQAVAKAEEAVKKSHKYIAIWIAGAVITVAAIGVAVSASNNKS